MSPRRRYSARRSTLLRRWALLSLFALSACAPCSFEKGAALEVPDSSQPFRSIRGQVTIRLHQDATVSELQQTAEVATIRHEDEERIVLLAGDGPEKDRTFRILLPAGLSLPFTQGDSITVVIVARFSGTFNMFDGVIADPSDGTVLLASSFTGDTTLVPGWDFVRGPVIGVTSPPDMSGGACLFRHLVTLSYGGRTAHLGQGEWRTICVGGRTWAVTGSAVAYGEGTRGPDSMDVSSFTIVRVRSR
jgi:hypothetical protein